MDISIIATILDFAALIVQVTGSFIMFNNSPINKSDGLLADDFDDTPIITRKNKRLRNGFLILAIGFLLAFISLILKTFSQ
jgi:hypothetical protein